MKILSDNVTNEIFKNMLHKTDILKEFNEELSFAELVIYKGNMKLKKYKKLSYMSILLNIGFISQIEYIQEICKKLIDILV